MKRSNPNRLGSTTVENEDEEPARRVPRLSYQHQAPTDILSMTAQQSLERIRHLQQPCMVELRAAMDAVFNELDGMNAATEREIDELQTMHELYQSYEIRRQHIVAAPQELVTLNVGGVLHQFSKSLLEKYPDSYLAELVRRAIASRSTREAAMTSAAGKGGAAKTRSLLETALEKSAETCEGTSLLPYSNEGGATGEGSSGTQHSPECDQDQEEIVAFDELCCDRNGYVHVDRNGEIFGTILNFLRGYKPQLLSTDDADMILCDLKYYGLNSLYNAIRERVYPSGTHLFEYGGGVTYERTRFRSAYCVGLIGDRPLMQGKHEITFLIKQCEYVGIGVVSDVCVCLDQEFHKTPNCCVYYMTGVFYANFPHHKKEEGLEKYTRNDTVTVVLDMDDHYITFKKNQKVVRVVPCNTATFLRFAVVMKLDSEVLILSSTEPSETVLEVVDSSHEHARTELTPAGGERTARAPRVNQSTRRDSRSSLENLSGSTTSIRDDGYTIIRHAIGVAVDLSTTNMVDEQRVHQLIEDEEDNDDEDEIPEDDGTDTASLGLDF